MFVLAEFISFEILNNAKFPAQILLWHMNALRRKMSPIEDYRTRIRVNEHMEWLEITFEVG